MPKGVPRRTALHAIRAAEKGKADHGGVPKKDRLSKQPGEITRGRKQGTIKVTKKK